jgi:hypothetical protein
MPLVITHCTKQLEGGLEILPNFTDGGQISTSIAVVWRTPYRDDVLVVEVVFVAFVDQLVCTCDQREVVDMTELIGHSVSKEPP